MDLSQYLTEPFTSDLPCHTQSVERMVKLTTEVIAFIILHKIDLKVVLNDLEKFCENPRKWVTSIYGFSKDQSASFSSPDGRTDFSNSA